MKSDTENIADIAALAAGRFGNELTFTFPEVLEVVKLCTQNEIAILGIEMFEIRSDGFHNQGFSDYDLQSIGQENVKSRSGWPDYVNRSNTLADHFIRSHPKGDDQVYVLTDASWPEFRKIQERIEQMKQQRKT